MVMGSRLAPSFLKDRQWLGGPRSLTCPPIRPFCFLQREKIVLGQDQPMLFQFHVMITDCAGGSLSFAATIFRILRELANLVPKIS